MGKVLKDVSGSRFEFIDESQHRRHIYFYLVTVAASF